MFVTIMSLKFCEGQESVKTIFADERCPSPNHLDVLGKQIAIMFNGQKDCLGPILV